MVFGILSSASTTNSTTFSYSLDALKTPSMTNSQGFSIVFGILSSASTTNSTTLSYSFCALKYPSNTNSHG